MLPKLDDVDDVFSFYVNSFFELDENETIFLTFPKSV